MGAGVWAVRPSMLPYTAHSGMLSPQSGTLWLIRHFVANLALFEQQMKEAETLFANQLRRLPESHETPGLLDDITFVGTTSGLKFVKLNWQPEIAREIYIELPIDIEVVGTYHEFGDFVSKIAGLPRIVTLHDFDIDINRVDNSLLSLKLQAKTYRYREAEEK